MFDQLSKDSIFKIIDLELKGLHDRIVELGYKMELTTKAKEFIAEKGYDVQFGARPLKRALQKYIEDEIAELILLTEIKEGDTVLVDFDSEKQQITMKVNNEVKDK